MRSAVISGGVGFVGSHLCEALLGQGFQVVAVDDCSTGRIANVQHLLGLSGFRLIHTDVCEPIDVPGDVRYVLHFASAASPPDYLRMPLETLRVGSVGTVNMLELARRKGARFLLASTSESYGDPAVHPQPETYWGNVNPVGPRSVYDEAKRFAEATTMAYRRTHDVDTAIVRIFNTYGPRMRADDGRAMPTFITQALAHDPITVAGTGAQTRSICYVDDLVDGIMALLLSDFEGPCNIGNPAELSILDLATMIRDVTASSSEITFVARPQDDPEMRRPDISLAKRRLGWEPRVDLADGLARTVAWFVEQRHRDGRLAMAVAR